MVICISFGSLLFVFINIFRVVWVVLFGDVIVWCRVCGFFFDVVSKVLVLIIVWWVSLLVSLCGRFLLKFVLVSVLVKRKI